MSIVDSPSTSASSVAAALPAPPSERGPWLLACGVGLLGVAVLVAVLTGLIGRSARAVGPSGPPRVLLIASTPAPAPAASSPALARAALAPRGAIVADPSSTEQSLDARLFVDQTTTHISRRWMEGFYPIYAVAERTFGVNWLLIASIHKQESAFSTAPSTYEGLNFAGCCGGPMQFNVTNGPVTTWDLVADSYLYGPRPAVYDHMTATHPSIYDDFDSIMAAAHLLSADGAGYALDGSAWDAAYDYYGHDATGVTYADQVLARAISWSQHGFCINCGIEAGMVQAVQAAYGAPVLEALTAAQAAATAHPKSGATKAAGTTKTKGATKTKGSKPIARGKPTAGARPTAGAGPSASARAKSGSSSNPSTSTERALPPAQSRAASAAASSSAAAQS
ncbi:MAG TPA: hypothetical protein VEJ23_08415 [Solirubrobacteraceae bacterium]|nr:hypothetical protein [Solirubrobacteraceae bacterium]